MINYTKEYYTTNNYSNYLERSERYEKLTFEILDLLNKLSLIKKESTILDFGCAIGFLIQSLINNGYTNVSGLEVSDWAINECVNKNLNVFKTIPPSKFDILFSLDVFEHLEDKDVINNLKNINCNILIARIPVARKKGDNFFLEISRRDLTHINCKTKEEWKDLFKSLGFNVFLHLNLNTIYDSTGVLSLLCLK